MVNAITNDDILKFVGAMLTYGGGGAAVAYLIFRFLGQAWIENKFKEKLAAHTHQQALEIQRLRVEIDTMLSGSIKLQDREFEILPEAWEKLDQAQGEVAWLVSPMQSYPNLNLMNQDELREFYEASKLPSSQLLKINAASNKTEAYIEISFWHRLNKVRASLGELQRCVARNGIFLESELKQKFTKVIDLLSAALSSKQVGVEAKDWKLQNQGWEKVEKEITPLYKSIESDIQQRLQSHSRRRVAEMR